MKLVSDRVINAISLASHLHRHHERHDENSTPYISHLASVAMYLHTVTDDENIIIAGIMHDSIEDVPDYTYDDLMRDCGEEVANIVLSVTENKSLPYKEMKLEYIDKIKSHGLNTLLVSLADKIHNAKSLLSMPIDKVHKGHLWLYEEILNVAQSKIEENKELYAPADILIKELEQAISNIKARN